MDGLDVLPLLLEEGSEEVEGHGDVLSDLFVGHLGGGDGDVKAGNLLQLPLDGGLDIIDLLLDWLDVSHWLWEHTNSVKDWTEDSWDLLDEGVGGEDESVLLGPLLDKFLVLVELLEVIEGGEFDLNTEVGDLILMLLIGNNADLKVWSWDVGKSDSSNETLILLWVIILKGYLHLDGLLVLSLLSGELYGLGSDV